MEKREGRAHQRRQKVAERTRTEKAKSKRSNRKEGDIMRAEVRRYKDAEKSLQGEGGNSLSSTRMTIQQGIYGHGCTSGAVRRGIGLNEETKARAEANLTRILALASHQQHSRHASDPLPASQEAPHHHSNVTTAQTTVSPCRFFLPRKSPSISSVDKEEARPKKQKADSTSSIIVSSPESEKSRAPKKNRHTSSSKKQANTSPSRDHEEGSSKGRDRRAGSTRSREQLSRTIPSKNKPEDTRSKPGISAIAKGRKSTGASISLSQEGSSSPKSDTHKKPAVAKTKQNRPKVELDDFKSPTVAVRKSLTDKGTLFDLQTSDLYRETLALLVQSHNESKIVDSASADTITDTSNSGRDKNAKAKRQDNYEDKNGADVLKAPSSLDYFRHAHTKCKVRSSSPLNTTVCPGTTIINPKALLQRYEDKLQQAGTSGGLNKGLSESGNLCLHKHPSVPKFDSNTKNVGRLVSDAPVFEETSSYFHKEQKSLTGKKLRPLDRSERLDYLGKPNDKASLPKSSDHLPQPECPKTVVVDPLHYLERCEKQFSSPKRIQATHNINTLDESSPIIVYSNVLNQPRRSVLTDREDYSIRNLPPTTSPHHCFEIEEECEDLRRHFRSKTRGRNLRTNQFQNFPFFGGKIKDASKHSQSSTLAGCSTYIPSYIQAALPAHYSNPSDIHSFIPSQQYIPQGECLNLPTNPSPEIFDKSVHMVSPTASVTKPLLQLCDPVLPTQREALTHEPGYIPSLHELQLSKYTGSQVLPSYSGKPSVFPSVFELSHTKPPHGSRHAPRILIPNEDEWNKSRYKCFNQPSIQVGHEYYKPQVEQPVMLSQVKREPTFEAEGEWSTGQQQESYSYPRLLQYQGPRHSPPSSLYLSEIPATRAGYSYSYSEGRPEERTHHQTYGTHPHHLQRHHHYHPESGGRGEGTFDWVDRSSSADFSFLHTLNHHQV